MKPGIHRGNCDGCGREDLLGYHGCMKKHYCPECAAGLFEGADANQIRANLERQLVAQGHAERILERGPDRVMVDWTGRAYPARKALEKGFLPDVIFIRDDGWSLGAPLRLARHAYDLWPDKWIGVLKHGETKPIPVKVFLLDRESED